MGDATRHSWGHGLGLTAGQREPVYERLTTFEEMPYKITDRTVWTKEELSDNADRWIYTFTAEDINEIEEATRSVEDRGLELAEVTQTTYQLQKLKIKLTTIRDDLINGIGFIVLRGLPVHQWTPRQASITFLGIGSYIGRRISQNRQGHMLGHVMDLAEGKETNGEGRIYRTHKAQTFHSDESDIVGLLCLRKALTGGEPQVVSTHNIYNTLRDERPDVLELLCRPVWFYDRKGEKSDGEKDWMRVPGYYHYKNRLSMKWDSYYVGALHRFWSQGLIPEYSDAQREAITTMEEYCNRLCLEMVLEPGDIQFVTNTHNLHARSEYQDSNDVSQKRWLQRLWLATSEEEGGWPLPFADSGYAKRGGVQVNQTPESYPLEAE